ncbi:MAG TPA: response regulator transcription factor [Verrucomicrobiae bacterium]|jgi:DNA-binding NarL/FixJ family response regulator|nr:response regulator transcription factor [Verrucomicrobiae bacterium]
MANESQRILIIDDHPLFREGLRQMIERRPEWSVCGEAADAAEALRLMAELRPDLAIVDISLGASSGLDLIKSFKAQFDDIPILVISMHDESVFAERAMRAKAMGYVMKHEPAKTVQAAIAKVLAGNIFLSETMSAAMLSKFMLGKEEEPGSAVETLSDRELQVFRLIGMGKGTRQIATELSLTIPTINSFRARIKEKLSLRSSNELVMHAMRHSFHEGANNRPA